MRESLLGTLLPPEGDGVLTLLKIVAGTFFLVGFTLSVISYYRIRSKGIVDSHAKWLMFLGMGLFPLLAVPLAGGVGMEASKEVSACASCHEMDAFIRDLKNPKSDSLASIHYRNRYIQDHQCYTCHSGYGIFGATQAKMDGLRHLWIHLKGRNTSEPIRLHRKFNIASCLACHGRSEKWIAVESHVSKETIAGLTSGEVTCLDCHPGPHNIEASQ